MIMAYVPTEDGKITISNIDKDLFPQEVLSTEPGQKFKEDAHWINYFLCGYKSILALKSPVKDDVQAQGMKILIDSIVPAAAGLSSSSAFTVCAAITTAHRNGVLDKLD